jgi:hypothetical protein
MVVKNMKKVSLSALHSHRRGGSRHCFLGENKNCRREVMGHVRLFYRRCIMGSWAHCSAFIGSPDALGCPAWLIGGSGPH